LNIQPVAGLSISVAENRLPCVWCDVLECLLQRWKQWYYNAFFSFPTIVRNH